MMRKEKAIRWFTNASFVGFVEADGIKLGITIIGNPENWQVSAVQTSAVGVSGVLADHAHEYLGEFKDFEKAKRRGTEYAHEWLAAKHRAKKKCECKPIRKGKR